MPDNSESIDSDLPPFIARWMESGASERANYQLFLSELCDFLEVERPHPSVTDVSKNHYVFERDVKFLNTDGSTSDGRIDLYKQGCFVLEAKQGAASPEGESELVLSSTPKRMKKGHGIRGSKGWDDAMVRARGQAELYAKALPTEEGWPPFLIVVDVGHSIELYADFTRSGKTYLQHPDPKSFRIYLRDLVKEDVRQLLRAVWTEPLSLDPSRRAAKVTRELATRLASLAKSLEKSKFEPGRVAQFLMRCLFTMFAEDVELIPRNSFSELLNSLKDDVATFPDMVRSLWESMDKGQFHPVLRQKLRRFNGGLFEECEALPLNSDQLRLLIEASQAEWRDVEPAIFGTLLERALDPTERHKLGAHYTPRAYVERLVIPTLVEPLREDWDLVRAAAFTEAKRGNLADAYKTVREFLFKLCNTIVLDPACGSGNFLYVALEHMKRIEGEILDTLRTLDPGQTQKEIMTVDPHQFHGIEVNPRAAAIADLVLWIGYLQWHVRTRRVDQIPEPIIQKFHNIECRDAVLAWDRIEEVKDENGQPVTRWDGVTMKIHPVTGEEVPDDSARVKVLKYINPRKADWPGAEFIVGNPPFIGGWKLRQAKGDGYVGALWQQYDSIPPKADYVMFWWDRAAQMVARGISRQFGFISTNSITQEFQRRVIDSHVTGAKGALRIVYAIPDHPWVDTEASADVRIAMTVGSLNNLDSSRYGIITDETDAENAHVKFKVVPVINSDLSLGADVSSAFELRANSGLSCQGVQLYGSGFILSEEEAKDLVLQGSSPKSKNVIRNYLNGRDFMGKSRNSYVIDFFGLSLEEAKTLHPAAYQRVLIRVKPERDQNQRAAIRNIWWRFGWERPVLRTGVAPLTRFIITPETSKHRVFAFVSPEVLPDNMLTAFFLEDAAYLGVLSSRIHNTWALSTGGTLEDRPRYTKMRCFDPFPFPLTNERQKLRIRELGEQLDAHRKKQQAAHPDLTLTGMYNVFEKLRSGEPLTDKEKKIHEQGLVSVLKQIHDDLDAAVFDAYGWPVTLHDEEILERLVALNAERAEEEKRGLIRWLRPEFQNPTGESSVEKKLAIETDDEEEAKPAKGKKLKGATTAKKLPWPKKLSEQVQSIAQQLVAAAKPVTSEEIAKRFTRANLDQVDEVLETLVTLGKAREVKSGKFTSV